MLKGSEPVIIEKSIDKDTRKSPEALNQLRQELLQTKDITGLSLFISGSVDANFLSFLGELLKELPLSHVSLTVNSTKTQDLDPLFALIPQKKWSSFSVDAKLSTSSEQALFHALTASENLQTLALSRVNVAKQRWAEWLAVFRDKLPKLETLALHHTGIDTQQTVQLVTNIKGLKNLDVSFNRLTVNETFSALCAAIAASQISSLNVEGNEINDMGAKMLACTLAMLTRRFGLSLLANSLLTPEGIKHFSATIQANPLVDVIVDDVFGYLIDPASRDKEIADIKVPTLLRLAAKAVAEFSSYYPEEHLTRLPTDCQDKLPLTFQQRDALSSALKKMQLTTDKSQADKSMESSSKSSLIKK